MSVDWLPELLLLSQFGGDWEKYLDAQYQCFCRDFIHSTPTVFHPMRWAMKRHPLQQGKEATFWHLISDGQNEADRLPDMRRCERICWIRPMIDSWGTDRVCCWRAQRDSKVRPIIALPDFSYVVVLQEGPEYVLLWTAYYVPGPRRREKFRNEWHTQT
jgi:hypothetical protein